MSVIAAAIIGGGALASGALQAFGAITASGQQQATAQQALAQQMGLFKQAKTALQPYMDIGTGAGTTLQQFTQPGANMTATLSQLPGFQFAQDWGQRAVQNLGTTTGLGGNTLTAGAQFATGTAQQNWLQYLAPLLQMYQTGAGAAGQLAGTAQGFGQQIGGTLTGLGQAQAAGTLGATGALAGTAQSLGNLPINMALLGAMNRYGQQQQNPQAPQAQGQYALQPPMWYQPYLPQTG